MLLQPHPPGFKDHQFSFEVDIPNTAGDVWTWLNDPSTFIDDQIWPYKVEFYSPDPENIPNGFHEGVLTNHTGPFINFAGKLTAIEPHYRDLQYCYGSYAFAFGWFRPYRLEFWTEEQEGGTKLKCTLSTYVKPSLYNLWERSQRIFWRRFKRWSKKSVRKVAEAKKAAAVKAA